MLLKREDFDNRFWTGIQTALSAVLEGLIRAETPILAAMVAHIARKTCNTLKSHETDSRVAKSDRGWKSHRMSELSRRAVQYRALKHPS